MIEILLGIYIGSMLLSGLLLAWHYFTTMRFLQAPTFRNLNRNLAEVGMYWSHSSGTFASLDVGSASEDKRKSLRNILWLSLLGFASLPGFLLLAAVIFSVRYLAKSRLEEAVMKSPLALQVNLSPAETEKLAIEMRSAYGAR